MLKAFSKVYLYVYMFICYKPRFFLLEYNNEISFMLRFSLNFLESALSINYHLSADIHKLILIQHLIP